MRYLLLYLEYETLTAKKKKRFTLGDTKKKKRIPFALGVTNSGTPGFSSIRLSCLFIEKITVNQEAHQTTPTSK